MGLEVTASHVVWTLAVVASVGAVAGATYAISEELWEDVQASHGKAEVRLHARIGRVTTGYDPATEELTLSVKNTGRVPMSLDDVTLLFDGELVTGYTVTIGGLASKLWLPNQTAEFTFASQPGAPARIVVSTLGGGWNVTAYPVGPIATVVVVPSSATLAAGGTQDFDARAYDANWRRISPVTATWQTTVGTVSSLDGDTGRLAAQTTVGSGTVTATVDGVDGVATVDVVAGPLSQIVVTPAPRTVQVGDLQAFTASGEDQHGNPISGLTYAWTTDVGSVVATGDTTTADFTAQTAVATGYVRATASGVSGEAAVTLSPGPPVSVAVSPNPVDVVAGGTQAFTAAVLDAYGNANDTVAVAWSTTAGSISGAGVLTAQTNAEDGRTVTATAGALNDVATVNVVPGALDHIDVSPSTVTLASSATETFTATPYDEHNNPISGLTLTWSATAGGITQGGVYTAPAADAVATITAASGGVSGEATATVVRFAYVSTSLTNLDGGTVTNVANLAEDGGGNVATLDEDRTSTAHTQPSAAVDRTFGSSGISWTVSAGSYSATQVGSDGNPAGAMRIRKTIGAASTGRIDYSWSQSAGDTATDGAFNFDFKFSPASSARNFTVQLVKPGGGVYTIGSRTSSTSTAWQGFGATTIPAAELTLGGTYTLRFLVTLDKNNDDLFVDNIQLTYTTHTAYRFGKELTVSGLPTNPGTTYTLEIRYRVSSGTEGLQAWTEGPASSWTQRATLSSTSMTTWSRTLTADEILAGGVLKLRLVDDAQSSDGTANQWEIDYVRVEAVGT